MELATLISRRISFNPHKSCQHSLRNTPALESNPRPSAIGLNPLTLWPEVKKVLKITQKFQHRPIITDIVSWLYGNIERILLSSSQPGLCESHIENWIVFKICEHQNILIYYIVGLASPPAENQTFLLFLYLSGKTLRLFRAFLRLRTH